MVNVNELLVAKKFCTLKKEGDGEKAVLMPDIPVNANSTFRKETLIETVSSQSYPAPATPQEILHKSREKRKQMEQKNIEMSQNINEECQELLDLLQDDSLMQKKEITKRNSDFGVSSGTSDLSDIETTPLPKESSYKMAQRYSNLSSGPLGKANSNFLASVLGLKQEEEKPKKVSKIEEFLNQESQPFDIVDAAQNVVIKPKGPSHLVAASTLLNALSGGSSNRKKAHKEINQLDVLVYGKEKRPPMLTLENLSLPEPLLTQLAGLNFTKPTQFQMNMWPAIIAQKNVIGIADVVSSGASRILAYMLPLLRNLILDNVTYPELGRGNGVSLLNAKDALIPIFPQATLYRGSGRVYSCLDPTGYQFEPSHLQ